MVLDSQGYGASVEYSEPSTEYGSNPFGSINESCSNQPGNETLSSSSNERSDQPGNGNGRNKKTMQILIKYKAKNAKKIYINIYMCVYKRCSPTYNCDNCRVLCFLPHPSIETSIARRGKHWRKCMYAAAVFKKKGESYGHHNYHNGGPKTLPKSMWIEAKQIGWQKIREAAEGCRRRCRRGMPIEM
ncbi:hypothetical protein GOBAR_AA05758 [Gossypium barbadense]|uniref:Uncharacterized protein n=1 Tax=Gossypium barbadense TaxID=3634 RepID=A0A2P5YGU4_GOSBA|nr:hypothetical protein GOBAR_AA05758 [Gossypium barbadense]